jgi:hypothetical protein
MRFMRDLNAANTIAVKAFHISISNETVAATATAASGSHHHDLRAMRWYQEAMGLRLV